MARRCTGKPTGRPKGSTVPLQRHPCRFVLGFADMLHWMGGMPKQKAWLLLTVFMTATDSEPTPIEKISEKMRKTLKQQGGIAITYTIPAKGNQKSRKIKEIVQPVDTLAKMSARYSSTADLAYRRDLALLLYLGLFNEGGDLRRGMIEILMMRLNDPDPQLLKLAQGLLTS